MKFELSIPGNVCQKLHTGNVVDMPYNIDADVDLYDSFEWRTVVMPVFCSVFMWTL